MTAAAPGGPHAVADVAALVPEPAVEPVPYRELAEVFLALGQPQPGLRDPPAATHEAGRVPGSQLVQETPEPFGVGQVSRVEPGVGALGVVLPQRREERGVHTRGRLGQHGHAAGALHLRGQSVHNDVI